MPNESIQIQVTDDQPRGRRRTPKRKKPALPLIVGVNVALLAVGLLIYFTVIRSGPAELSEGDEAAQVAASAATQASQPRPKQEKPAPATPPEEVSTVELISDDGQTIWVSPTAGPPLSLRYTPAGSQVLLHVRPVQLITHPEGEKALAALGPWGQRAIERLLQLSGRKLNDIESLLVTPVVLPDGTLDQSLRLTLTSSTTLQELAQQFASGTPTPDAAGGYLVTGTRAYWLPADDQGSTLVVCPREILPELLAAGATAPLLVRDLERLHKQTDASRTATLLVSPRFLDAGGSRLLIDSGRRLRDAIDWLFGREESAFCLSLNWGEDLFLELRSTPQLRVPPQRYSQELRQRIDSASSVIEDQVLAAPWHPHGRRVVARFPAMLRKLAGYTRKQVSDRHALLRCYLPVVAGHNLLMASELMLTQPRTVALAATQPATSENLTLTQRLAKPTSLVFTKDTLESSLQLLSEDLGVPIVIRGRDLQLEGITKNQSFGLDLRDQPAGDILLEILLRANPDRTATGPADPLQKLVYVIHPGADGKPEQIEITTRTAAVTNKETLPTVFTEP